MLPEIELSKLVQTRYKTSGAVTLVKKNYYKVVTRL